MYHSRFIFSTVTNHSARPMGCSGWPNFYWKKCVYFRLLSNKTLVNILFSASCRKRNAWYFWRRSFGTISPLVSPGVNYNINYKLLALDFYRLILHLPFQVPFNLKKVNSFRDFTVEFCLSAHVLKEQYLTHNVSR